MIDFISIKNFKSLKETGQIPLKPVTLLTGLNGMGKSSLIQTLLLLRQSPELEFGKLKLNNGLVKLGTSRDICSSFAEKDEITISISSIYASSLEWQFDCSENSDQIEDSNSKHYYSKKDLLKFSIFSKNFQYISSDRIAQQELHEASQSNLDQGFLGTKGEYAVHLLYKSSIETGSNTIPEIIRHEKFPTTGNLFTQTEAWLGEVSPGVRIDINQITSDLFKLGFSFSNLGAANPFKPSNVGFGISYSLAVIVALLSSKQGSLIIIENPEAHLHPRGQAKLAELICKAARNGAQIILETHSDHILNGIRVMNRAFYDDTKNELPHADRKGISNEDVAVYWFERDQEDYSTKILPVYIEPNARIKRAPAGFFDQMDFDLQRILGF